MGLGQVTGQRAGEGVAQPRHGVGVVEGAWGRMTLGCEEASGGVRVHSPACVSGCLGAQMRLEQQFGAVLTGADVQSRHNATASAPTSVLPLTSFELTARHVGT